MHPLNIFPDCKSVISIAQPIPRGTYRGITEGTHWNNYTYYAYNRLNTVFRPIVTDELSRFIEDRGFEAVPVYPGVEGGQHGFAMRPPDFHVPARKTRASGGCGRRSGRSPCGSAPRSPRSRPCRP